MSIKKELENTVLMARLNSTWITKLKVLYLGYSFGFPLILALVFFGLSQGRGWQNIITGTVTFSLVQPALLSTAKTILADRRNGSITLFRCLPITPLSYSVGICLSSVLVSVPSLILFLIAGEIEGFYLLNTLGILFILAVAISSWIIYAGLGYLIAMSASKLRQTDLYIDLVWAVLIFLSPTYYAMSTFPSLLQYFFYINPVTYLSFLVKYLMGEVSFSWIILVSAAVQVGLMLTFLTAMAKGRNWYER